MDEVLTCKDLAAKLFRDNRTIQNKAKAGITYCGYKPYRAGKFYLWRKVDDNDEPSQVEDKPEVISNEPVQSVKVVTEPVTTTIVRNNEVINALNDRTAEVNADIKLKESLKKQLELETKINTLEDYKKADQVLKDINDKNTQLTDKESELSNREKLLEQNNTNFRAFMEEQRNKADTYSNDRIAEADKYYNDSVKEADDKNTKLIELNNKYQNDLSDTKEKLSKLTKLYNSEITDILTQIDEYLDDVKKEATYQYKMSERTRGATSDRYTENSNKGFDLMDILKKIKKVVWG